MAIIMFPNKRLFIPKRWESAVVGNVHRNRSPMNRATQAVDFIGDAMHWRFEYGNNYTEGERDEQRGYFDRFRGGANLCRCWPPTRPVPRGTLRGSPTLASGAVEGSNEIVVAGSTGSTLLPGDFLNVTFPDTSTQLVEIHEASGTGTITCTLVAPLRKAANSGSAIIWLRPTADFFLPQAVVIPHEPKISSGFTVELEEFFS